jgi:hypothetical protein
MIAIQIVSHYFHTLHDIIHQGHEIANKRKDNPRRFWSSKMTATIATIVPQEGTNNEYDLPPEVDLDDEDDAFDRLHLGNKRKLNSIRCQKRKQIKIVLTGTINGDVSAISTPRKRSSRTSSDKLLIDQTKLSCSGLVSTSDSDLDLMYMSNWYDDDEVHFEFNDKDSKEDIEDCFKFLEETHEDQDPDWIAFQNKLHRENVQTKIEELDTLNEERRKEIESIVQQQIREKQIHTESTLEKYKTRLDQELTQKMARVEQWYRQKTASENQKINDGVKILQERHQKETQAAMQQHRHRQQQLQQQRRMAPDVLAAQSAAEWQKTQQQLQGKHSRSIKEFTAGREDSKKKAETDYRRDREKIRNEYDQKMVEVESSKEKAVQRNNASAQQLRQRFLKRHMQKMIKQREELLQQLNSNSSTLSLSDTITVSEKEHLHSSSQLTSTNECGKNPNTIPSVSYPGDIFDLSRVTNKVPIFGGDNAGHKDELNPQLPMKSCPEWVTELEHHIDFSGASARSNFRRNIMSKAGRQVTVEIHNEGVWISVLGSTGNDTDESGNKRNNTKGPNDQADGNGQDKEGNRSSSSDNREFLAWGVKACSFLEAIVCGEIPPGFDRLFERLNKETVTLHGGQIRCVILDLRTSESTASSDRAVALREYKEMMIADLAKRESEMNRRSAEAEKVTLIAEAKLKENAKMVESTQREVERAKRGQDDFANKFRKYLGPGAF